MSNATKEIWLENVKTGMSKANVKGAEKAGFPEDTHYFDISYSKLEGAKSDLSVKFSREGQIALIFVMNYWDGIEMVIDDTDTPTTERPWLQNSYEMKKHGLMTDADILSVALELMKAILEIRGR